MQSAWILCICVGVCVGALAVEVDPPNTLGKTTENGTSTDVRNTPEVKTAVEYSSKSCSNDALMVQVSDI